MAMYLKNYKYFLYIWRFFLLVVMIFILAWLIKENFFSSSNLILRYKKSNPASLISNLYPEDRTIVLPEDKISQRFFRDPIYFNVLVPFKLKQIAIDITWQNKLAPVLKLGVQQNSNNWQYYLKNLQNKNQDDPEVQALGNDWYRRTIIFNREDFFVVKNKVNFILSVPGLENKYGQILIGDITATISRSPITWQEAMNYIKKQWQGLWI